MGRKWVRGMEKEEEEEVPVHASNGSDGAKAFFFFACLLLLEYMAVDEITTKVYTGLSLIVGLIKHILVL